MNGLARRLSRAIDRVEPRGTPLAAGRSLLAAATLVTILFSTDAELFIRTTELPDGLRCDGVRAISLWCLSGPTGTGLLVSRILAIAVLVAVMVGFRPRWTCVPHWYISFSFASAAEMSNGGDAIAQVTTMLLIPMCLSDDRIWQWTTVSRPLQPARRGSALAAHLVIRGQICLIYLVAAATKLMDPLWRQGGAMYFVAHHPQYGFPPLVLDLFAPMLNSYWPIAIFSWSVIVLEVTVAVLILGRRRHRMIALVLGCGLHLGIIVMMSLVSFGMVMIALVTIASMSVLNRPPADRLAHAPEERKDPHDTGGPGSRIV
jgi:antimicrobial peptide system SdpB family protein